MELKSRGEIRGGNVSFVNQISDLLNRVANKYLCRKGLRCRNEEDAI